MKTNQMRTEHQNKRLFLIVSIIISLLLVPLVAMQFSAEVNWSVLDFLVAGIFLSITGFAIECVLRIVKKNGLRIVALVLLFAALILTWIELAVGIIGSPFAGS